MKVRDALRNEVTVVLDERDKEALDAHEEGRESTLQDRISRVDISKKVCCQDMPYIIKLNV